VRTDPGGQPTIPEGSPRRAGRFGRAGGGRVKLTRASSWFREAISLSSDRRRSGQQAFSASPFSRLALTHALSLAGDALVTLALAGSLFFDISPHAARSRVALSLVLTMAPFAVVAPLLGPIIDRAKGGRRLMVLVAAGGRAVACLFMARYVHGLLLFPAAFVTLVCSKAYVVAKAALVPAAVERPEDLIEANSKLAVGGALVGFGAAIPGVAILKLLSAATLLRIDSLVFIACGISALRIRPARPAPIRGMTGAAGVPSRGAVAAEPLPPGVVQLAAVAVGSLRFSVGFMTFLVAFAFRRGHAAAWWYGVVLAASVGGNLVGAVIAPRLRGRVKEENILAGSVGAVALVGLLVMQLAALHRYPAAALLAAMVGIAAGSAKLAFDSLVQREVPTASQGRAFARFEAVFQLVWVVGALVPVVISMSLGVGFVIATLVTAAAVGSYEGGGWLGRRGRLPLWWPGVASGGWRPEAATTPSATALGGAVGGTDVYPTEGWPDFGPPLPEPPLPPPHSGPPPRSARPPSSGMTE
jgi:Major Facilitator Superfamily